MLGETDFRSEEERLAAESFNASSTESRHFENSFGSKEYIDNYYPTLNVESSVTTLQELSLDDRVEIDVNTLAQEKNITVEAAENLLLIDFQSKVAKEMLEAFPKGGIKSLDVGGGPTIYQHIMTALETSSITHAEFLEQNRNEVKKWLANDEDSRDWDSYFKVVQAELKGNEDYQKVLAQNTESADPDIQRNASEISTILNGSIADFKDFVRGRITSVAPCDVFKEGLGLPNTAPFEHVASNFTVESATGDRGKWGVGMRNVMSRVAPGGYLSMTAIRNAEWYAVGKQKMPAVPISERDIQAILAESGFEITQQRILTGSSKETDGYDGMILVNARKIAKF